MDIKTKYNAFKDMTPSERVNASVDNKLMRYIKDNCLYLLVSGRMDLTNNIHSVRSTKVDLGVLFCALYRNCEKYPELKIDELYEEAVVKSCSMGCWNTVYAALETVDYQLTHEKKGEATFKIKNKATFDSLKAGIEKYKNEFLEKNLYLGLKYENNIYGYAENVNSLVKEQTGYCIL